MKSIVAVVLVLIAVAGYWNVRVYEKKKYLMDFSKPFHAACQTGSGCVLSPAGWREGKGATYVKDAMEYTADKNKFEIRWHIATDVFLVAQGGRGKEVTVERVVE